MRWRWSVWSRLRKARPELVHDAANSGSGDGTATAALVLSIVAVLLGAAALGSSLLRKRSG